MVMVYISVGNQVSVLSPTIYDPRIVHFSDDMRSLDNWIPSGDVSVVDEGVALNYNSSLVSKGSMFAGRSFFTVKVVLRVSSYGRMVLAGFTDDSNNPTVWFEYVKGDYYYYVKAYVNGEEVRSWLAFPTSSSDITMYVIKGKRMVMIVAYVVSDATGETLTWYYGILVDPSVQLSNVFFKTYDASLTIKSVTVYEASGVRFGALRPIWTTGNKILHDGVYYYFATVEEYATIPENLLDTVRLLILRTRDFVSFEHYKHVDIGDAPHGMLLYSFFDGSRFYMWMRNELGEYYQNGLHPLYLVVLDSDYNLLEVNLNVSLSGYTGDKPLASVYFVNINGEWYALLSAPGDGLHLFSGNPWTPSLSFVKKVYSSKYIPRIVVAHPVSNTKGSYILISLPTSWHPNPQPDEPSFLPPRFLISDTNFDSVTELTRYRLYDEVGSEIHTSDGEFILSKEKVLYVS
jgi:hypothetical protein